MQGVINGKGEIVTLPVQLGFNSYMPYGPYEDFRIRGIYGAGLTRYLKYEVMSGRLALRNTALQKKIQSMPMSTEIYAIEHEEEMLEIDFNHNRSIIVLDKSDNKEGTEKFKSVLVQDDCFYNDLMKSEYNRGELMVEVINFSSDNWKNIFMQAIKFATNDNIFSQILIRTIKELALPNIQRFTTAYAVLSDMTEIDLNDLDTDIKVMCTIIYRIYLADLLILEGLSTYIDIKKVKALKILLTIKEDLKKLGKIIFIEYDKQRVQSANMHISMYIKSIGKGIVSYDTITPLLETN